jgi:DNA-binding transcriptional ArsR family regulator
LHDILVSAKLTVMIDPRVMTVLASPRRSEILRMVWDNELAAGDIHRAMPDITFGAVSLQLKRLIDAELVEVRSESRNRYYRARKESLGGLGEFLEGMWNSALWQLKLAAELEEGRRGPRPRRKTKPRQRRRKK